MTDDEYTREEVAKAFKAAKNFLWWADKASGQKASSRYWNSICASLQQLVNHEIANQQIVDRCKNHVMEQLDGDLTVPLWLKRRRYLSLEELREVSSGLNYSDTSKKVQAYRHAWLDSLIAEFSQPLSKD